MFKTGTSRTMSNLNSAKCFVIFLMFVSGCGPVYQTSYSFVPPEAVAGRSCVYNCEIIKRQCIDLQNRDAQDCERRSDWEIRDCESRIRLAENRSPKWYECGGETCSADIERCDGEYRGCYELCGGRVKATTVCVSNCEQAVAPRN